MYLFGSFFILLLFYSVFIPYKLHLKLKFNTYCSALCGYSWLIIAGGIIFMWGMGMTLKDAGHQLLLNIYKKSIKGDIVSIDDTGIRSGRKSGITRITDGVYRYSFKFSLNNLEYKGFSYNIENSNNRTNNFNEVTIEYFPYNPQICRIKNQTAGTHSLTVFLLLFSFPMLGICIILYTFFYFVPKQLKILSQKNIVSGSVTYKDSNKTSFIVSFKTKDEIEITKELCVSVNTNSLIKFIDDEIQIAYNENFPEDFTVLASIPGTVTYDEETKTFDFTTRAKFEIPLIIIPILFFAHRLIFNG